MYLKTDRVFKAIFSLFLIFTSGMQVFASSDLKAISLTCEYNSDPLGIDVQKPGLGWSLSSGTRDQVQTGYEILVSDNLAGINNLKGNMWTTGMVKSAQTIQILYSGKHLSSYCRYFWRVRAYDRAGNPSSWSDVAWFETAALSPQDWKGEWIGDERPQFKEDADFYKDDPMPLLKKAVNVNKKVISARLYISGLGYYEAYLNGTKIGNSMLDPGFTSYQKKVLYATYDISTQVREGRNVFTVMLGNGWYNPLPMRLFGAFNLRDVLVSGRPCLNAQVLLEYSDGTSDWIVTDNTWKTSTGAIVFNNVYLGEHDDGRLLRKDFFDADFSGWKAAKLVAGPSGGLAAQMQPPIRITRIVKPVKIFELGKDTFIVDMGQNFAGVAKITVSGKAGDIVRMRYGEALLADGRLNYFTTVAGQIKEAFHVNGGPGAPKTAWQEDSYILKGQGSETWFPRFTFHGFRYVQITGWPGKPSLKDIEGLRMNADVKSDGTFACSNDLFNRLHQAIQWTFLSNLFSIQSDCPGREKMGYGADMVVTSPSFCYNYNMANFYRKSVNDFANNQLPDGGITETAPNTGISAESPGGDSGPLGWQLAFPFLQKLLYDYYGDKQVIANYYPAFVHQMAFLESKANDNLFDHDIGDHAAIDPKPIAFDASLFYYHHAVLATQFAGILGKTQDSVKYSGLAERIKQAIINKYEIPGTGRYDNATEGAQLFALWYGLPREKEQALVVLKNEFARHNYHVSTGIFSTKMLFDVFSNENLNDIAYKIANQRDYPGWGYMLSKNATTLWESWDYPENSPSQNHPMFGSVDEWFYSSLLGIKQLAPGFKKITIRPQPAGDLTWAKGAYQSVSGKIVSAWEITGGTFNLHVTIPANTSADVWIRANNGALISEGGTPVQKAAGFKGISYRQGYAVITVGSGEYNFQTKRD